MNKNKKIQGIIVAIIIIVLIICVALIAIIHKQKNDEEKSTQQDNTVGSIKIEQVSGVQDVYKVNRCVNNILADIYDQYSDADTFSSDDENDTRKDESFKILEDLNITDAARQFYINDAYSVNPNEKNTIYFAKGYLVYDLENKPEDANMQKQDVIFTIVCDNENKSCELKVYGADYTDIFNYNDDITKTTVNQDAAKALDVTISDGYSTDSLTADAADEDIAYWYYDDYKLNTLYFPDDEFAKFDDSYKQEKYNNSVDTFKEYVNENRETLENAELSQYGVNDENGGKVYVLVDTAGNEYKFSTGNTLADYKVYANN